ncbi:MAG: hypothetical protein HC871_03680 [Rhizobiales bacterium]|nr:hypothetical protein [Hyphomicrobiales bacterium]
MKDFTEDDMKRPLFEEPTKEHERLDAWDEPRGFMIGGMANLKREELAQQYFDAACLLLDAVRSDRCEDYKIANPALYLFRHSIELLLKSIVRPPKNDHNLGELAIQFNKIVNQHFCVDVPQWISDYIGEFAKIDHGSTAFRYSDRFSKKIDPVEGEYHVDIHHLRKAMTALNTALVRVLEELHRQLRQSHSPI